jgi:hypothetical protein
MVRTMLKAVPPTVRMTVRSSESVSAPPLKISR